MERFLVEFAGVIEVYEADESSAENAVWDRIQNEISFHDSSINSILNDISAVSAKEYD